MMRVVLATVVAWLWATTASARLQRRSLDARDALDHQNDFYLPRSVVPRSYRLQLVPDLDQGVFSGQVWVNVSCLEPVDSLRLHAHQNLNTTSAGLTLRRLPTASSSESDDGEKKVPVASTKKNFAKQWYVIVLGEKLQKGSDYELHVSFSGRLNDASSEAFFRGSYTDHRAQERSWYAATAMETTKARQVFPCFDEPALKATFQISVAARRKYHVWSNMPLGRTHDMAENQGWLWHHFPVTPIMSTFSVGVFVSDFHYATTTLPTGGFIRLSSRPELLENLEKINKLSEQTFNFAEEYLNFSYPLEKLDVIVLPLNSSDYSSDSWGLVMIRESDMGDVVTRTTATAGSVLTQWLGHLATPYWWSGIHLHSALVGHLVSQFMTQKLNMTAGTPAYDCSKGLAPAISGHEDAGRALRLLRLLNYTLTEETFRQGLHMFLEDRQYKTFTEHNLWAVLTSRGRQDQTLDGDVDVEEVARSWLAKERYPVVTVTRNYEENTAAVEQHVFLRERPHNIFGKERMLWYIPVMYISADNLSVSEVRPVAWLKNEKQVNVEDLPGEDKFIVVNPDEIGTFVVNYDAKNWGLLSEALREGVLSAETRAKLLHDAWSLAYAGELDFATALNLTLFLRSESTPQVWDRFFAMVDHLRRYLGATDLLPLFDEYAKRLVDHCVRMLGPAKADEDASTRKLRETAEVFQYILSDQQHNTSLDQEYKAWMENPHPVEYAKNNKVPFEMILRWGPVEHYEFVLEYAIKLLDSGLVDEAKAIFVILARSSTQQLEKVDSLLNALLLEDNPNMVSDVPRACINQLSEHYNGSLAIFHFVQDHWDSLRERLENNLELWKLLMSAATARLITEEDLIMEMAAARGASLLMLAVMLSSAAGGKLLHAKQDSGDSKPPVPQHGVWRRSIDLLQAADHQDDLRLPREVVPTGYRLELVPHVDEARFRGRVWINVTCLEGTDTIVLHVHEDLNVSHSDVAVKRCAQEALDKSVEDHVTINHPMNHKGSAPAYSLMTISSTKKEPSKQWYIIVLTEKLRKDGSYLVEMSFSGDMSTEDSLGFFRGSYQDHKTKEKRWFAATNMRPTNARRVFPCFDEPSYKVPFEVTIAKQSKYMVLANMPTRSTEDMKEQPGWKWLHFQKSPPLSTFSVGFLISDLEHAVTQQADNGTTKVRIYGRPHFVSQLQEAAELAPKVLRYLEDYLGLDYPASKLDLVALPHFLGDYPADHWGLILFKESYLVGDTSLWHISEELSNQWVGHFTTPHWWNYGQINFALSKYLANTITMQWKNEYTWSRRYFLYYGYSERHPFPSLGTQETIKADKCTWLLRMLNYTLTGSTFRSGLKKFLEDRQHKTFSQDDVWAALTAQGRKDDTLPDDVNIADVAKSWLGHERLPVVTVNRNYDDNTADVEQHMFLRERPHDVPDRDKMLWYIPIMYLTPDNMNVSAIRPAAWMRNQKEITIRDLPGADNFIIVNPQEIGMFMVNYDVNNWVLLSDALLAKQLPAPVRAKLLHDAWNLAYAGELNFASALNMTLFLKGERDPHVWDVMFTMIDHVGRQVSGTEAGLKFEEYCRRLLNSLLNSMDEDVKWSEFGRSTKFFLSQISYQPYISTARDVYRQWMDSADPDAGNPVSEKYLCSVFEWGSEDEWEFGLQRVINFPDSRKKSERTYLLNTLAGCPRQAEKIQRLLNITLVEGNGNFSDTDVRYILSMLTGGSTGYTTLLKFLLHNWDVIKLRYANKPHMWEYLIDTSTGSFNTQEGLDLVSELYVAKQGEFGTADAIIERSLKIIKEEARWSDENLPTMEAWLEWALAIEDTTRAERGAYPMG